MSNEKFTPGEWHKGIDAEDKRPYIFCGDIHQKIIADVFVPNQSIEQATANAHLIAAAPEMYRQLEELAKYFHANGRQHKSIKMFTIANRIDGVLKKARGEE